MKASFRYSWLATISVVFLSVGFGACSSSSDNRTEWVRNGLSVVHFSLPGEESVLYEHHGFDYTIGIVASDDIAPGSTVTANVFLVEADAQEDEESTIDELSCFVGSTEIELGAAGDDVFVTDEGMTSVGCYDAAAPGKSMSFAVSLEPSDRLISDESMDDDNVILFTEPMSGSDINQSCVGADGQPGCVIQLVIEPSPGIDVELMGIELESSVVLNYSRISVAEHPSHDEMHTPNLEVTTEWWLEGVSPDEDDALRGNDSVLIKYSMKPAELAQGWLPLTVHDHDNLAPFGHDEDRAISDLQAGSEAHFTDSLFIEGETYAAVGPGGEWNGFYHFELRACASTSFVEVDLPVEDEAANNCVIAPFFLTERLIYNPDIVLVEESDSLQAAPGLAVDSDEEYHGLYKKLEASTGDSDSLKAGISLLNQARFGVRGDRDLIGPVAGSGVPYATLGSTLTAYTEGFIDAELLLVDFTHTVTHKESPSVIFERRYKPSVRLHMFGIHFVDVVGSMTLPNGSITITKNELEQMSQLFVEDDDGATSDEDEMSIAQRLCDKTGINALVMELSVDLCATGSSGIDYNLTLLASDTVVGTPFEDNILLAGSESVIGANLIVDPYAQLEMNGAVNVNLGLLKGHLETTVALLNVHLAHEDEAGFYREGARFYVATGTDNEFVNNGAIGTEAYLEEEILNGNISFDGERVSGIDIKCCFHPKAKWKEVSRELYSWDGITIGRQKLWSEDYAATARL